MSQDPRRLFVSACGINSGGGLVLLSALVGEVRDSLRSILLDERLAGESSLAVPGASIAYIRRSFIDRVRSLSRLAAAASEQDVLLCFNSLPPLRRSRARVVAFVQAPHFVGAHRGIRYTLRTSVRMLVERIWFRLGAANCDEIWVQTRTMADALSAGYPSAKVAVVPLVDDELLSRLKDRLLPIAAEPPPTHQSSFFYPADSVGHKNHGNLLRAWSLLAREGLMPHLSLTLEPKEFTALIARLGLQTQDMRHVRALGRLPRPQVLDLLRGSSALIFPSLAETFGIPLLEATALGIPILASERDFVRDVCIPQQTFDPGSPRSIAMAVCRFIDAEGVLPTQFVSARQFVERLLA